MITPPSSHEPFLNTLNEVRRINETSRSTDPSLEVNRLRYIEFRRSIEMWWIPIITEYFEVMGRLWFGFETRMGGAPFHAKPFDFPLYTVRTEIYGPMAIFTVEEKTERERLKRVVESDEQSEARLECYKLGCRCRVLLEENGQYHLQSENRDTLLISTSHLRPQQAELDIKFNGLFLIGPFLTQSRWKDPF